MLTTAPYCNPPPRPFPLHYHLFCTDDRPYCSDTGNQPPLHLIQCNPHVLSIPLDGA